MKQLDGGDGAGHGGDGAGHGGAEGTLTSHLFTFYSIHLKETKKNTQQFQITKMTKMSLKYPSKYS